MPPQAGEASKMLICIKFSVHNMPLFFTSTSHHTLYDGTFFIIWPFGCADQGQGFTNR